MFKVLQISLEYVLGFALNWTYTTKLSYMYRMTLKQVGKYKKVIK